MLRVDSYLSLVATMEDLVAYAEVFAQWFTLGAAVGDTTPTLIPDDAMLLTEPILSCVCAVLQPEDGWEFGLHPLEDVFGGEVVRFESRCAAMREGIERSALSFTWKARLLDTLALLLQQATRKPEDGEDNIDADVEQLQLYVMAGMHAALQASTPAETNLAEPG